MDQRRFRQLIYTSLILVIGSAALSADGQNLLRAQDWLETDKIKQFEILSQPYAKAPDNFNNDTEKSTYQIGEALFRTPTLLGGQAAKARISCNSCHLSGGGNKSFLFPNISGAPGTADVSNSFFSSFRGNQNFDPIAIPDLRLVGKVSKDPDKDDLRNFIKGLIVEEFNGNPPNEKALDALTFYIQKLGVGAKYSAKKTKTYTTVSDPIIIIEQSFDNISIAINNNDMQTANLLVDAIRHQLGLIYERYNHRKLEKQRRNIIQSSKAIAQIRNLWEKETSIPEDDMLLWKDNFNSLKASLISKERLSLYNIKRLRKAVVNSKG